MRDLIERLRALAPSNGSLMFSPYEDEKPRECVVRANRTINEAAEALTTAQAEIEALKAERDKLAGIVQGWHYLAVGPDEMGDYYTHKQLVKLSEPYASPALKALSGSQP